jgi:hypothetical protein
LFFGEHEKSVFSYVKVDGYRRFVRKAGNGNAATFESVRDHPEETLAVLQRITLTDGPVVFLCGGADDKGTMRVAGYLAENWNTLYADHRRGGGDFAQLLAFPLDPDKPPLQFSSVNAVAN